MSEPVIAGDRPFYKRTEFYLLLLALIGGGLLGSGVIGPDTLATKLIAMVLEALAVLGYTIGRTLAKAGAGSDKPGYLTSEFWLTLLSAGLMTLQGIQVVPAGGALEGLLAALLGVLPPMGYQVARGKVKAASGVLGLLVLVLVLPLTIGACAGWQSQSHDRLNDLHAALRAASGAGETVLRQVCDEEATRCRDARRSAEAADCTAGAAAEQDLCKTTRLAAIAKATTCDPLRACHKKRQEFDTAMVGGQLLVLDAFTLVNLGDAAAAKDLEAILTEVRKVLKAASVTIRNLKLRGV